MLVAVTRLGNGARVVRLDVVAVAVPVTLVRAVELDRVLLLRCGLGAGVLIGLVLVRRVLVLLDVVAGAVSGGVAATGGLVLRVALIRRVAVAGRGVRLGVVALRGVAVVVVVTLVGAVDLDGVLLLRRCLGAGVLVGLVLVRRVLALLHVVPGAVAGRVAATGGLTLVVGLRGAVAVAGVGGRWAVVRPARQHRCCCGRLPRSPRPRSSSPAPLWLRSWRPGRSRSRSTPPARIRRRPRSRHRSGCRRLAVWSCVFTWSAPFSLPAAESVVASVALGSRAVVPVVSLVRATELDRVLLLCGCFVVRFLAGLVGVRRRCVLCDVVS